MHSFISLPTCWLAIWFDIGNSSFNSGATFKQCAIILQLLRRRMFDLFWRRSLQPCASTCALISLGRYRWIVLARLRYNSWIFLACRDSQHHGVLLAPLLHNLVESVASMISDAHYLFTNFSNHFSHSSFLLHLDRWLNWFARPLATHPTLLNFDFCIFIIL